MLRIWPNRRRLLARSLAGNAGQTFDEVVDRFNPDEKRAQWEAVIAPLTDAQERAVLTTLHVHKSPQG